MDIEENDKKTNPSYQNFSHPPKDEKLQEIWKLKRGSHASCDSCDKFGHKTADCRAKEKEHSLKWKQTQKLSKRMERFGIRSRI